MTSLEDVSEKAMPAPGRRSTRRRKWLTWSILTVIILVVGCASLAQIGLWRGRVALEARQNKIAVYWLHVAGICWQRSAEWHFLSAIACRRAEDFEAVGEHLQKANELGWSIKELEREQTLALAQTAQFEKIRDDWAELFRTAGSDGPEICLAYINFALSRFRLDEAEAVLEGWKHDFPNDAGPHAKEGKINMVLLQWDAAEASFRRSIEIDPTLDEARLDLASCLIERLKFKEAEQQLRATSDDFRATPRAIVSLSRCISQRGEIDEAFRLLEVGIESSSDNVLLLGELGRLRLMQGDYEAAISALNPVVERTPANTEIRYALAQALRNSGDKEAAQEHFRLVDEGTRALRKLPQLQTKINANPSDVETRFKIASTTWRWKSRRDGVAWLQSILEFSPEHQGAHELLAEHYEAIGDTERVEFHKKMSGQPQ